MASKFYKSMPGFFPRARVTTAAMLRLFVSGRFVSATHADSFFNRIVIQNPAVFRAHLSYKYPESIVPCPVF